MTYLKPVARKSTEVQKSAVRNVEISQIVPKGEYAGGGKLIGSVGMVFGIFYGSLRRCWWLCEAVGTKREAKANESVDWSIGLESISEGEG